MTFPLSHSGGRETWKGIRSARPGPREELSEAMGCVCAVTEGGGVYEEQVQRECTT